MCTGSWKLDHENHALQQQQSHLTRHSVSFHRCGFSILGNVQQQDHLIVFDLEKLQIGFQSIKYG
jgi:hypothetical protein